MLYEGLVFHISIFFIGMDIHLDLDHNRILCADSETSPWGQNSLTEWGCLLGAGHLLHHSEAWFIHSFPHWLLSASTVSKRGLDCIRHCKLNPSLQGLLPCHGKDSQTHSVLYKPTFSSPGAPPPFTTCEFHSFILTWQCFLLHLKVWLDFWDLLSINAQAW